MSTKKQLADALRALLDADPSQVKRKSLAGVKQAGREALTAYDAEEGMADKLTETERQLALYRQAMNEIDDRIEYTSFDKRTITDIMANLTDKLARKQA